MTRQSRSNRAKTSKKSRSVLIQIIFITTVLLAILSFFEMPNVLVGILRLLTFFGFVVLACGAFRAKRWLWVAMFLVIGLLFQPSYGYLGAELVWNIIDVIFVIIIGYAIYKVVYPASKSRKSKNC